MTLKAAEPYVNQFIEAYIKTKKGQIIKQPDGTFKVTYPDAAEQIFTYEPAKSREKKIPLIAIGSQAFQQILKECLENGALCQISLKPKENFETLLRYYFKDTPFDCKDCLKVLREENVINICTKPQPCYHKINNSKIASVKIVKQEVAKYYLFNYSVTFHNKLRSKSNEIITIVLDEECNVINTDFNIDNILKNETISVQDCDVKLRPTIFDSLKSAADQKLHTILKKKVLIFDLPLSKEKNARLDNFSKRLKRERREQVVSKKQTFDILKWQANYEALLKREEESFFTQITVRLNNLLVVNTYKVKFEICLHNHSTLKSSFILGINHDWRVTCQICKKEISEGYATQDSFYVCCNCIKQSVDTGKIYTKKTALMLDETLNEYIERNAGFVCSVCGKIHSRLLEFKCSYDGSSICIHHYGICDVCGKVFSKLNLSYTDEFKHQLCPQHTTEKRFKEY